MRFKVVSIINIIYVPVATQLLRTLATIEKQKKESNDNMFVIPIVKAKVTNIERESKDNIFVIPIFKLNVKKIPFHRKRFQSHEGSAKYYQLYFKLC